MKTLSIFELGHIYYRGWQDANNQLFRDINTGNVVYKEDKEDIYKINNDQGETGGNRYLVAVSHFLLTESQRYISIRNYYLAFKPCIYLTYTETFIEKKKIGNISKAIPELSAQIKWFEKYCEDYVQKSNAEISQYKELLVEYERKNYPHKVKAYEQKQKDCSKKLSEQLEKANQIIETLKNEKERLIRQAQMRMLSIRSKRYLRLRYYYEVANRYNSNIPLLSISEENLTGFKIFDGVLDFDVLNKDILKYIDEM